MLRGLLLSVQLLPKGNSLETRGDQRGGPRGGGRGAMLLSYMAVAVFYPRYFSTPELLEPVLQPRIALYCGDELM